MNTETAIKTIIVKARNNSEWDNCNCALIAVSDKDIATWKHYAQLVKELKEKDSNMFQISLFIGADFFNATEGETPEELMEFIEDEAGDEFKYLTSEAPEMQEPEQRLDCHIAYIDEDSIKFTANGKHTGEEFWTSDILLNNL